MRNPLVNISRFRSWFSSRKITLFWYRSYRRMFLALFVAVFMAGAWYWYYNLYQYSWDEKAKRAFLDSYAQETDFKEISFKKAVSIAHEKRKQYDASISLEHDLFRLDVLSEQQR